MTKPSFRIEQDALGPRQVPADALYGAHTSRSLENFRFSGTPLPLELIHGMALIKQACARANARLGLLPPEKESAIAAACEAIRSGRHDSEFAVELYQAGSGTSSHMNVIEVIANLANESLGRPRGTKSPVHPNDDVNMGQSTNNVFPSAAKIALRDQARRTWEALWRLESTLQAKATEFADVMKTGRTHLQDAVPMTLGQVFAAYARAAGLAAERISDASVRLEELGVGGNAIGTGLNTKPSFRAEIMRALNELTGGDFRPPADGIQATQFMTDFAQASAALRSGALDLQQIANNLRLLASGPRSGLGEILLPPVEPGSSIMPGKVNPSICEAVNMACMQIQGLDHAVALACGAGQLELNTHMPLIAANTLHAARLLAAAADALAAKGIEGIRANRDACQRHLEHSAGLATLLNPRLGYDQVARLVQESVASGKTLRQLIREKELMSDPDFDELLKNATAPNL